VSGLRYSARLRASWALAVTAVALTAVPSQTQTPALDRYLPELRRNLEQAIIPYWYPGSIDGEHGGFAINSTEDGRLAPTTRRMMVSQARMVWLSARLAREGYRVEEMKRAAAHGFAFLRDRMWDQEHGGFYWEIDAGSGAVAQPNKHVYAQAFGLYGLSEYYMATGDAAGLELAAKVAETLERRAHDPEFGGYREYFARDWSPLPPDTPSPIGGTAAMKLMNTHLHVMEAFANYFRASRDWLTRERLDELIAIQSNAVIRKQYPACTDQYLRDWTPVLDAAAARVSYGHDVENVWLLVDALDAVGRPTGPYLDLYKGLFAYSRTHGFDEEKGGFFESGPLGQPADRRNKIWWVQAEALVSALTMYKLTKEPSYLDAFDRTLRFVQEQQTDWTGGEWHATILPDGSPRGLKATVWKAGYHDGRSMVESLRLVRELTASSTNPQD
jgi:mannose/cellobiose epimerase-like protein (N-acyl-D-glucosamine 2-epimerase family)